MGGPGPGGVESRAPRFVLSVTVDVFYSVDSSGVAVFDDFLAVCFVVDLFLVRARGPGVGTREGELRIRGVDFVFEMLRETQAERAVSRRVRSRKDVAQDVFHRETSQAHRFEMHALGVKL